MMKGMVRTLLFATFFICSCKGSKKTMAAYANDPSGKTWNIGRFSIALPESSLTRQTQVVEDVTFSYEPAVAGESFKAVLDGREKELGKKQRSPVVAAYQWTGDTGGVLYVNDISFPNYYEIEARRALEDTMLVAVTSSDKKFAKDMIDDVRQTLAAYKSGDFMLASSDRFGMQFGSLHEKFRHQEDVHAEITLAGTGAEFEFDSKVVARPVAIDLFERAAQSTAEASASGVKLTTLRKTHRKVNGQDGFEVVDAATERGVKSFDARFEAGGSANSASQPHLIIHLATDSRRESHLDESQFLALWDATCEGIKAAP